MKIPHRWAGRGLGLWRRLLLRGMGEGPMSLGPHTLRGAWATRPLYLLQREVIRILDTQSKKILPELRFHSSSLTAVGHTAHTNFGSLAEMQ